ncbi:MAG: AAA family ATPase [Solirubrobacteraceae bacterium]|nr:AAA family ATPase [Solirubrobacteraceae bacterium]
MHLKSLSLKGFKSFPDRTKLEFSPGVAVIVGPNGSGKSNVTDAVLWAMGEQSPLAVRGQSMQDVIFGGGHGVQARSSAEVELVLDNSAGELDYPMSEISIKRRLDRSGDGEYRLNGAKCRLVDVLEVLSDTGLGKEMHSVVSQGRVEAIVTSKPKDRRLLIEEAAGLGKHRKRRRRAQLKLERTQQNLDRALDVEREARTRLRPLKRQAEAAELHERLQRQSDEARYEMSADALRAAQTQLAEAERERTAARAARDEAQAQLGAIAAEREQVEQQLAAQTERRESLARRVFAARTASERIDLRLDRVKQTGAELSERVDRRERQLAALREEAEQDAPDEAGLERIESLEAEITRLDADRQAELERELTELEAQRAAAQERVEELTATVALRAKALAEADAAAEAARSGRREAERAVETARREAARVGADLAACNQFLRTHAGSALGRDKGVRSLADALEVKPGYERALSAALDGRLRAAVTEDLPSAGSLLDRAGNDGGLTLVANAAGTEVVPVGAPTPGAIRLADLVGGDEPGASLAKRLLAAAWVVEDLDAVPADFTGVAVTTTGRVWDARAGELRQSAEAGEERVLAERNRRDELIAASEVAVQAEQAAKAAAEQLAEGVTEADLARERADDAVREIDRARAAAEEEVRRAAWLIEQRRKAPEDGAAAVRRAQLDGELQAERRNAERAAKQRDERTRRIEMLQGRIEADRALAPVAERLSGALQQVIAEVANRVEALEAELSADRAAGEGVAQALRDCAGREAALQTTLRERGDQVTNAEVRAQRERDRAAEATGELSEVAERLGFEAEPATEALAEEKVHELKQRIERLARRREQLGPVNPLAKAEYDEAVAHVEELEMQRTDLETALRELKTLIRDTDRQIRETFEETFTAAAKNFEELAQRVFPGGRGRLRLVKEEVGPKPVLGGAKTDADDEAAQEAAAEAEMDAEAHELEENEDELLGVEIEITPAGKSMKRLTLLSGGEKSMTALAFLFAVFLAKPCPFYILDEVEAALDDLNITRFLDLLETYSDRAQFIVVTHQKRTMEAADVLYGVSMGSDGVSKVVSRKMPERTTAVTAA